MNGRGLITASMRELERVKVIEAAVEGRLRCFQAAQRLGLRERQIQRLVTRYRESGAAGLVSGKRGKPSNRELPIDLRARAMALVRERYADFGPTLAGEKLRECHGMVLAKETVRRWISAAGAARLPGRVGADRRQRARLVRGSGFTLHAARICRRCDKPAHAAALYGDRVDLQLL